MIEITRRYVLVVTVTALAACGGPDSAQLPLEPDALATHAMSAAWSSWSEPVPVVEVNTTANDTRPALSRDGLSLYFHSDRDGGFGRNDIWVSRRACLDCAWHEPAVLGGAVNTAAFGEGAPHLSRDGHWLFFHSNRSGADHPGARGGNDLWVSYREHVDDDFGWGSPINLGPGVNTAGNESQPSFFENEGGRAQLFFVRPAGPGRPRIWVSEMQSDGAWGTATEVEELADFNGPSIHPNGLEMYVFETFKDHRIWHSTRDRADIGAPWSAPVELVQFTPGEASVFQPFIHALGRTETLLMSGVTATGAQEIYLSTRTRGAGAK